ncbi:ATP-binding protein [Ramlibacter sp.]|uniref:hybrid sensor histidine kinase/response regulator n=1 Tax=Ramlibacter sp. TaxID=1917967 RepID=UPI0026385C8D|nr:ATP-binding protein [Ramlibacter sp.]MDB5956498.1 Signal transduction histidine kinase [Ramlibacter sp.]
MASRFPPVRNLLAACLASFVLAAAVLLAFGSSTPLWYANAVGVIALLRHPRRTWPVLAIAIYAADSLAFACFGHGPPLLYAACHLLEIVLVALLSQRFAGVPGPLLERARFARLAAVFLLVPLVSAAAGAFTAAWVEAASFIPVFRSWYLASALGLLVGGVSLLGWTDLELRRNFLRQLSARDAATLLVGAIASGLLVQERGHQGAIFLTFPLMFAVTWFFGLLGATVGLLFTTVSAVIETLQGHGVFILLAPPPAPMELQLETVQLYLAALLLSNMPLAVLHEHQEVLTEQARRAGEARTEFLAAMSHEIRTPMTGVLGMVDLLGAEPLTERQRSYLDAMQSSGRHLLSVINDILDFSRIESGRLELHRADFELSEVTEDVRSVMHPLALERGIALDVELAPDLPAFVCGDPMRLKQVLLNLVSNAVKFTSTGSVQVRVTQLSAAPDGAIWLRFEVRDTGVGIDPAQLQRLFAPFVQADRSISRQYGGSGLGLAISKRLVELMGGRIDGESVPLQGSVFHFEVPLHAGEALPEGTGCESQRPEIAPLHILVAEDLEINRRILQTHLERHGHSLVFAANGAEALAQLETGDFDLVLMDVQMPIMDGVEATRQIRDMQGPKAAIPILGLSANVLAREREQYLRAGMNDCLTKPVDWNQLAAAMAQYGGAVSAVGPAVTPCQLTAEPGLLDDQALAALGDVGSGEVRGLLRVALESFGTACDRMLATAAPREELRREAHDICGMAGMLGLRAVCQEATRLERIPEGADPVECVDALRHAVDSTTELLLTRGVITPIEES